MEESKAMTVNPTRRSPGLLRALLCCLTMAASAGMHAAVRPVGVSDSTAVVLEADTVTEAEAFDAETVRLAAFRRDSLSSVRYGLAALDGAWRRLNPFGPVSDSLLDIARADTVAERRNPQRRHLQRCVDSLMAQVRSVPFDSALAYAQPDFRLPIIMSGHVPIDTTPPLWKLANRRQPAIALAPDLFSRQLACTYERELMRYRYASTHLTAVRMTRANSVHAPTQRARISTRGLLEGERIATGKGTAIDFNKMTVRPVVQADKWHYRGQHQLQMTQTALSDNWYKGGENNMTIFTDTKLGIKRYDERKITSFEATFDLRLSGYYTKADTIHPMRVSDNQFTLDAKYGYKAWKRLYYSANLYAKTPIFEYFAANSRTPKSAFLSPLELNVGLGMDYKYEAKDKKTSFSLMLAPMSYNLKYVDSPRRVSVTSYGIDEGRRALNQFGSTLTAKLEWKITGDISWTSRLYVFTSYESLLGEFENTFNFKVNNLFTATLYVYPRFDDSKVGKHWQMKEMLTFGFNYVW